jgi:hypothetical protein
MKNPIWIAKHYLLVYCNSNNPLANKEVAIMSLMKEFKEAEKPAEPPKPSEEVLLLQ